MRTLSLALAALISLTGAALAAPSPMPSHSPMMTHGTMTSNHMNAHGKMKANHMHGHMMGSPKPMATHAP